MSKFFCNYVYKCESCVKSFRRESYLNTHNMKNHKESYKLICDICQSRFGRKQTLTNHVTAHYVANQCRICGYMCQDNRLSFYHKAHHTRVMKCLKCDMKFMVLKSIRQQRSDFFEHYRNVHRNHIKGTYICDYCGKSVKKRLAIEKHLKRLHTPIKCEFCPKTFSGTKRYKKHVDGVHPSPNQPTFYCVECDKHLDTHVRYQLHLYTVAHKPRVKKQIPCPVCGKIFTKNIYMVRHHEVVHLKKYRFKCELCNKPFTAADNLARHIKYVHEGIQQERNKICNICGRGFSTQRILINHIRTHTGERPYACEMCPAAFAQKTALVSHTKSQHRNKHIK